MNICSQSSLVGSNSRNTTPSRQVKSRLLPGGPSSSEVLSVRTLQPHLLIQDKLYQVYYSRQLLLKSKSDQDRQTDCRTEI